MTIRNLVQKIPQSVRLAILIVILAKILIFSVGYAETYVNSGPASPLTIVTNMFYRWDASNYVSIAKNWYVNTGNSALFIVFFPLYPILIRLFTVDFNYINLTALIVSNGCSLVAFFYLYKLAKLEFSESVALKAVLFLSVFPVAYFLSVPYSEGLFFALVIASIYYARLGKWNSAGVASLFAALTRLEGLLLLPVLLVEYLHQKKWKLRKVNFNVFWALSSLAGFLIYLNINNQITGNPFTFIAVESTHWFTRFDPWSGLIAAYYWATNKPYPDNITIGIAPIVFAAFGLSMLIISVWKRFRPAYIIYMFLSWGLAVSTSWWISVPRYIMAMFPMFMTLSLLSNRKSINIIIAVTSAALLCFFTILFSRGWWAF
jgi:Gpi18-like mannosyltransferase